MTQSFDPWLLDGGNLGMVIYGGERTVGTVSKNGRTVTFIAGGSTEEQKTTNPRLQKYLAKYHK